MTKKTSYICELCGYATSNRDEIVGLEWPNPKSITTTDIEKTNTHLCMGCIKQLRKIFDRVR